MSNRKYLWQVMTKEYKESMMTRTDYPQAPATEGGNSSDYVRAYYNTHLSNEEIMEKVKYAIEMEKTAKLVDRAENHNDLEWDKLLSTKLFNSPKI